jgi:hypothetical protein
VGGKSLSGAGIAETQLSAKPRKPCSVLNAIALTLSEIFLTTNVPPRESGKAWHKQHREESVMLNYLRRRRVILALLENRSVLYYAHTWGWVGVRLYLGEMSAALDLASGERIPLEVAFLSPDRFRVIGLWTRLSNIWNRYEWTVTGLLLAFDLFLIIKLGEWLCVNA